MKKYGGFNFFLQHRISLNYNDLKDFQVEEKYENQKSLFTHQADAISLATFKTLSRQGKKILSKKKLFLMGFLIDKGQYFPLCLLINVVFPTLPPKFGLRKTHHLKQTFVKLHKTLKGAVQVLTEP